ncbi:MAG: hypothetical protein ACOYVK_12835 [Bacillota bacterium]
MNYIKSKKVEMKYPWKINSGLYHSPSLTDSIKNENKEQNTNDTQIYENNSPKENYTVERYKVKSHDGMNEFVVNLYINNLCGNYNEVSFCPPDISMTEGNLMDLNEDSICKILDVISNIPKDELKNMPAITVPIYIFNINNVLSSGNKNEITIEQDA